MRAGEVGILNVGAGDTKFSFDPARPEERERAAKVVDDMLKRGYAILVSAGERDGKPLYFRAEAFDPNTCEYIIAGAPEELTHPALTKLPKPKRSRVQRAKIAATNTHATAVARSAGG